MLISKKHQERMESLIPPILGFLSGVTLYFGSIGFWFECTERSIAAQRSAPYSAYLFCLVLLTFNSKHIGETFRVLTTLFLPASFGVSCTGCILGYLHSDRPGFELAALLISLLVCVTRRYKPSPPCVQEQDPGKR